jgi:hypothetical protein
MLGFDCLEKLISGVRRFLSSVLVILFLIFSGCSKENTAPGGNPVVEGTIQLEVHSIHHSWDVSGIVVYLAKNATEFPGRDSSVYDLKGQSDGYGKYTFEKLYPGNYYVYASGYDAIWGSYVFGSTQLVLDETTVVDNFASITLIVSE